MPGRTPAPRPATCGGCRAPAPCGGPAPQRTAAGGVPRGEARPEATCVDRNLQRRRGAGLPGSAQGAPAVKAGRPQRSAAGGLQRPRRTSSGRSRSQPARRRLPQLSPPLQAPSPRLQQRRMQPLHPRPTRSWSQGRALEGNGCSSCSCFHRCWGGNPAGQGSDQEPERPGSAAAAAAGHLQRWATGCAPRPGANVPTRAAVSAATATHSPTLAQLSAQCPAPALPPQPQAQARPPLRPASTVAAATHSPTCTRVRVCGAAAAQAHDRRSTQPRSHASGAARSRDSADPPPPVLILLRVLGAGVEEHVLREVRQPRHVARVAQRADAHLAAEAGGWVGCRGGQAEWERACDEQLQAWSTFPCPTWHGFSNMRAGTAEALLSSLVKGRPAGGGGRRHRGCRRPPAPAGKARPGTWRGAAVIAAAPHARQRSLLGLTSHAAAALSASESETSSACRPLGSPIRRYSCWSMRGLTSAGSSPAGAVLCCSAAIAQAAGLPGQGTCPADDPSADTTVRCPDRRGAPLTPTSPPPPPPRWRLRRQACGWRLAALCPFPRLLPHAQRPAPCCPCPWTASGSRPWRPSTRRSGASAWPLWTVSGAQGGAGAAAGHCRGGGGGALAVAGGPASYQRGRRRRNGRLARALPAPPAVRSAVLFALLWLHDVWR